MEKKYYIVEAKCGHVGRNNFTIKTFPTKAENPSEAATKVRGFGRVKHHWKDAIVSVRKVNEEEFRVQLEMNMNDPYFRARNIQDQRAHCQNLEIVRSSKNEDKQDSKEQKRLFLRRREKETIRYGFRGVLSFSTH